MSTDPTTSSEPPPIVKGQRVKRMADLSDKYINKLLELPSMPTLRKFFDEQDIKDAELEYASEQMMEYARSHLRESLTAVMKEEHIEERLNQIEALSEHKEEDYESVYTNSINQRFGTFGDKFHRIVPDQRQVGKAILHKLKRKQLEHLRAQRDALRLENKAAMQSFHKSKQNDQGLPTPLPEYDPSKFDPS